MTEREKLQNTIFVFCLLIIWMSIVHVIVKFFYVSGGHESHSILPRPSIWSILMFSCLIPALWEELVFRYAPIKLALLWNEKALIPVIIISSFLFASGHNNGMQLNVMIQGVWGFMVSFLFLWNKLDIKYNMALHFTWNLIHSL